MHTNRRSFKENKPNMSYLDQLNDNQRAAVVCTEGPMLVIAGAGSGKTRVLTYKIAHLLEQGVPAYNILALTFTNKAAREMKSRIATLVGEERARYLWMGTFHSIFARILRQEAEKIGYTRDYSIYDTTDSKNLLKSIVKEMELDDKVYKPNVLLERLSSAKNYMMQAADYANDHDCQQRDRMARLYRMNDIFYAYTRRLRQANAMDFDDLLFNMNVLLATSEEARVKYQNLFRYVLVDEYQDTNYAQYKIVTTLAQPQDNICVVGDDAQSIYSFRGATIQNILNFQKQYATSQLFKLEQNYRSTQTIVNAANSLISKNQHQIHKEVYSEKEVGEKLLVTASDTDRAEGTFIAGAIGKRLRGLEVRRFGSYDDFAVLYRTNSQSRVIEDELRKQGIPYRIYGSVAFYQRKEIKDAISYFRLVANLQDDEALLRVINFPARGIGNTTMGRVLEAAHEQNIPAFRVVSEPAKYAPSISGATQGKLTRFAEMITSFRERMAEMGAYEFAQHVLQTSQVMLAAQTDKTPEGQDRLENLRELLNGVREYEEEQRQQGNTFVPITDFLAEVALLTDQDENLKDDSPRVSLMTVHAAKGLEFPVVIIAGLEENLFPSAFAQSPREIEEERRLLYVAITRAEEVCLLSYARTRFRNGKVDVANRSTFLHDIHPQYLDCSGEERKVMSWQTSFHDNTTWRPAYREYKTAPVRKATPVPSTLSSTINTTKLTKTTGRQVKGDKTAIETAFAVGSRVQHGTFGKGTVLQAYTENGNEKIEIRFDGYSAPKTLLLKFAKLTSIN